MSIHFAKPTSFIDVLHQKSLGDPDRLAYRFITDEREVSTELTYGVLDRRAREIGALLQQAGLSGQPVLLIFPTGPDYVCSFFGCLYAGAIAVPVYPPTLNHHLLRFKAVAADAHAKIVLTSSEVLSKLRRLFECDRKDWETVHWKTVDEDLSSLDSLWKQPDITPDSLALLQYTSGSTGQPKGVMVSHGNLIDNSIALSEAFGYCQTSHCVSWLPIYHDMGLIGGVLQPLHGGFPCTLMSPATFLQKPLLWLELISRYRASISGGPNFAYDLCVHKITAEQKEGLDLSAWKVAFNGSESVRAETLLGFSSAFASCGFRAESFYPCYGLAESTLFVAGKEGVSLPTIRSIEGRELGKNRLADGPSVHEKTRNLVGCGRPSEGHEIAIINPETLTEVAEGEIGEIWISGPSVAKGYWNRPEETRQTFLAYPNGIQRGPYLRSGDLGAIKDGDLFITGRWKDLIIIRGVNHYPEDIEQTLNQCHPALRPHACAAFSIENNGEEKLVIVQELSRSYRGNTSQIINLIRSLISEKHLLQVYSIALIRQGSIPKTSSGKIQRHACRAYYQEGALKLVTKWRSEEQEKDDKPTFRIDGLTFSEEEVRLWLQDLLATKLGLAKSELSVDQPLLTYGLDSLTTLELSHAIEVDLGVSITVADFLQGITLAQLAARIANGVKIRRTDIVSAQDGTYYPLTPGQEALLFLSTLHPHNTAYNLMGVARINGEIDQLAIRDSFQKIIDRHECLRTTFTSVGGRSVQVPRPSQEVYFRDVDASSWDEDLLRAKIADVAYERFDLENGPLFRVTLFSKSAEEHFLLLSIHHIIADFWSLAIIVREFGMLYKARNEKKVESLAALPFRFRDYVRWQSEMLSGSEGERMWQYWQKKLSGELPALMLPFDRSRPPVNTYSGSAYTFALPQAISDQIKYFSRAHKVTVYVTLLAAFQVLLYRYTNQHDILIGTPMMCRARSEWAGVRGYFVNPVVIRADLRGNPTFESFLLQIGQAVVEALEFQEYPFPYVVERLHLSRDLSSNPLAQALFTMQQPPSFDPDLSAFALGVDGVQIELGDINLTSVAIEKRSAGFDLSFFVAEMKDGLKGAIEYNTDIFDSQTIERMAAHWALLLSEAVKNPETRVTALTLLRDVERHQLLVDWNRTARDYPHSLIHQLIAEQAQTIPEAVAVISRDSMLTYRELDERANQLAHYLRGQGVGVESRVGVCLERSVELVVALLGVLKAGAAYVPLDPTYPAQRVQWMIEDAGLSVILTDPRSNCGQERAIDLQQEQAAIARCPVTAVGTGVAPENLAYIIYTSGSTGKPKGVAIAHQNATVLLHWAQEYYSHQELSCVLAGTSVCFDLSVFEIFVPLMVGGKVMVVRDVLELEGLAARNEVVLINTVPSAMAELLRLGAVPESVRVVNLAGEPLPKRIVDEIYGLGQVERVVNLYGPTEDTTYTTVSEVERGMRPDIGRPIAQTRTYILDERQELLPVGVEGELCIGGSGLARGYWGKAEQTAEKFIPDPYSAERGARMYRTGDLVKYRVDGAIEYLGRKDHQVKVRGYRIELGEIEEELRRAEDVKESVVVVKDDGAGNRRLVAYVVSENQINEGELKEQLRKRLPDYLVPQAYVRLDRLPLTANGKIDRRTLPELQAEKGSSNGKDEMPATIVEQMIATIWGDLLGKDQVWRTDNFFELGGHSLLATQVYSRLKESLGIELPLRMIFETPVLRELADNIEQRMKTVSIDRALPIKRVARSQAMELSFAQQRLWFLEQLNPGTGFYNLMVSVQIKGELKVQALEESFRAVIRRHESLRTRFASRGGKPVQVIEPMWDFRLELERGGAPELERILREESERGFDLERGPLLRVKMVEMGEQEHVLVLNMHHIISDGWSLGVLIGELSRNYDRLLRGEGEEEPELPVQYLDYAQWQREWLEGEVLERQLEYWREQLEGEPLVLELPADRARPEIMSFRGSREWFRIPDDLTQGLKHLSREEGATLYMTLLSLFVILLHRYTGRGDIVIGTDVANRNRSETENLIGFFVNQLVLRIDASGNPDVHTFLKRVREVTLNAYSHQDLPFDHLVWALKLDRSLKYSPFFQVKFVFQNAPLPAVELSGLTMSVMETDASTTKLDLTLSLEEYEGGMRGWVEYSTDLFNVSTIRRMIAHFKSLIKSSIENPSTVLCELEMISTSERELEPMQQESQKALFERFKKQRASTISLPQGNLVTTELIGNEQTRCLLIKPEVADPDLTEWSKLNREWVENLLLTHGAVLFRGFGINSPQLFECFMRSICTQLFSENGEHPRRTINGKVYTPVFYPPDQYLLWHNENSFNYRWPSKICFGCLKPADRGGETTIVNSRKVFELIDPQAREKFIRKQIKYVRNYGDHLGLNWQTVFKTTDRKQVEEYCRQNGMEYEWKDGDRLRTSCVRPAFLSHPKTGDKSWFNQAQHWHFSCLDRATRQSVASLFNEKEYPRNCYYGDGTPIEDEVVRDILKIYKELEFEIKWQAGDVLLLDNILTAHGRNPYVGERSLLVALGDMLTYEDSL